MSSAWHKPGNIVRVSVPQGHVVGHEQADNPQGPRPWLIISDRFTRKSGLFVAVPLSSQGHDDNDLHISLSEGDIDPVGPSPIPGSGYVLLDQVRALSIKRVPDPMPCGRMRPDPFAAIREELAALMEGTGR